MQVLLRNQKTKLYLATDGQWTSDRKLAISFGQIFPAIQFVSERRLYEIEALLTFGDDLFYDVAVRLSTDNEPRPPPLGQL